ncbi:MAG: DUF2892 domain-containing protein [Caldilineaceae bacterium]|nr:DUF2892 domain-containing protein [Caldilineaceae bacterium]
MTKYINESTADSTVEERQPLESLRDAAPSLPTNVAGIERIASILVGAAGLFLLSRRLLIYLALATVSGYFILRGLSGHCALYRMADVNTHDWSRAGHEIGERSEEESAGAHEWMGKENLDDVGEASWESFPASDPPATW